MGRTLLAVLLLVCAAVAERKRYDGYKVIQVNTREKEHVALLRDLELGDDRFDVWHNTPRVGGTVYIMTPPDAFSVLMRRLRATGMDPQVYNHNVQDQIAKETRRLIFTPHAFNVSDFNRYEDIMSELDRLAGACASGVTCRTEVLSPKSVEGRDLKIFHMTTPGTNKKGFFIDSTIHAREWLAPATFMQVLNHMVTNYNSDADVKKLVDTYDWHMLAVVNPDGYVFSWDNERYWRKSRNQTPDPTCIGTDLNRNFNSTWAQEGTSEDPCSNIYHGSGAASEPETQAVQTELLKHAPNTLAFVTMHTAAQMILYPWGYTENHEGLDCVRTDNHENLDRVGQAFANAIENTHNTIWRRGTGCETLYSTTGTSRDYARGPANIPYSFTPELRGPDFVTDPSEIPLSFQEFWNGLVAMVQEIETIGA